MFVLAGRRGRRPLQKRFQITSLNYAPPDFAQYVDKRFARVSKGAGSTRGHPLRHASRATSPKVRGFSAWRFAVDTVSTHTAVIGINLAAGASPCPTNKTHNFIKLRFSGVSKGAEPLLQEGILKGRH